MTAMVSAVGTMLLRELVSLRKEVESYHRCPALERQVGLFD